WSTEARWLSVDTLGHRTGACRARRQRGARRADSRRAGDRVARSHSVGTRHDRQRGYRSRASQPGDARTALPRRAGSERRVKRRKLIPEVIQTSAMDCGPACLAALLGGHGVSASYERLREACQTDVDGTSIDTIEEAAVELGLAAEQRIVPVDHVLQGESAALPAIAITRQPDGSNHFVVLWSQLAGRVQVMDPAVGRRWV